jgi:molybdopterin-guanine dinucleotide biosynthesis protein A
MNENVFNQFEGFVLAGGKSSRMKTDKAYLEFGGETFLTHAARTLAPVCEGRVKIILNRNQTAPENFEYICDEFAERGALGGIHAGLKNCRTVWAIILAVDLPFVSSAAIQKLIQIALETNEFSAIVPVQRDGRLQPLCAVYRVNDCLPKLENLLNKTSSASVKDFLQLVPTRRIEQIELTTDAGEDLFFNVNRPADFRQLG